MQYLDVKVESKGSTITYHLILSYKRIKNVIFRVSPDETTTFNVSVPYGITLSQVEKVFLKNLASLTKLAANRKMVPFSDKTYLFGTYLPLTEIKSVLEIEKNIKTLEDFYHATKKLLLKIIKAEVEYYSLKMHIPVKYKVRIRSMKTRWASNSKQTLTLSFNERLIHYHIEIIRALVVHELVHYYVNGHGQDFYLMCEKYYPNYRGFDKMLKEHNYGALYKYN